MGTGHFSATADLYHIVTANRVIMSAELVTGHYSCSDNV